MTDKEQFERDNILLEANGGTHNCGCCHFSPGVDCPEYCPSYNPCNGCGAADFDNYDRSTNEHPCFYCDLI
jgi:hypothetical protein